MQNDSLGRMKLTQFVSGIGSVRTATKRAGGSIRNHGGSPGKRLGLKKFSGASEFHLAQPHLKKNMKDQYVEPGNIIVRQRGTVFHPGPHVRLFRTISVYNPLMDIMLRSAWVGTTPFSR
jgi:large subunit ribosomal protein L27